MGGVKGGVQGGVQGGVKGGLEGEVLQVGALGKLGAHRVDKAAARAS